MGLTATPEVIASQAAPPVPPGTTAPAEIGTPPGTSKHEAPNYGENNRELPDDMKAALYRLLIEYKSEAQSARRDEVRRVRQAHEFWKGLQYVFWAESDQSWHLPFEEKTEQDRAESPRYAYVTNIYQAFGLSIIAVLSQDWPAVRLWPQSPEQEEDIATAEAGTDVIEVVERNNNMQELMQEEAFLLWADGKVGAYVRYVVDGGRFGYHDEEVMDAGLRKLGEDVFNCPQCGYETPAEGLAGMIGICEQCGREMTEADLSPAAMAELPRVEQVVKTPNGAEIISLAGSLELKTPPWAKEQHQFPYLIWQIEAHKAQIRAAYSWVADKLQTGVTIGEGTTDVFERTARLSLVHGGQVTEGGDITTNLVTFERAWLRPWAFWLLDDKEVRDKLLEAFPDGCYVAFAGSIYCESRNETMDDHWRVLHALPGDGQNRPAMGTSLISVQERYNTLSNVVIETAEYGIPPTYAASDVLDFDSLPSTEVVPGNFYPVNPQPGQSVRESFFTPEPGRVSPDVIQERQDLGGPVAQFLTGAFPALFGGAAEGAGGETAAGYAMARDQALGRIGLVWRRMKAFHAQIMLLAVECFRKNRVDDVEVPIFGEGARWKSRWIRLADLKGNIFAYPESDETYPVTWGRKQAAIERLLASPDPYIQAVLHSPDNLEVLKQIWGVDELVIPDEGSRTKQYREIEQLLQEQATPQSGPDGQPLTDPLTGEPILTPSVMPDPFGDNHQTELEVVRRWMNSDAGQAAKLENPGGHMNVRAHGQQHERFLVGQQIKAQVGMAPPQAPAEQPPPAEGGVSG